MTHTSPLTTNLMPHGLPETPPERLLAPQPKRPVVVRRWSVGELIRHALAGHPAPHVSR